MIDLKHKLIFIMMIGLFGCASPKQEDFVGVWIGDSLTLELRGDGSCIATGDNKYLLLGEDVKRSDVNTYLIGKWSLEDMYSTASYSLYNRKILRFMFVNKDSIDKFYIMMEIHKEPYNTYYIYMDLSDPDDMNRFKFEKQ